MSKKQSKPTKPSPVKAKSKLGSKSGNTAKGPKAAKSTGPSLKIISANRKARHQYQIIDSLECGILLRGSEVKSLRNGKCQLDESYGRVKGDTLWLIGCDIAEYPQATIWNHEPKRPRQLLVHKREMLKFVGKAKEKGLTLVPLQLYFNPRGIVKCEIALCRGLQLHDKREKMKKMDARRAIERATRRGR